MSTVRYIVDDVADAVEFYVSRLGFEVEFQGPAFATVVHDDLTLGLRGRVRQRPGRCSMAPCPAREAGPGSS